MMIQKSKDKPLQFDANLEKIFIRTFEKRSRNRSRERAVLYFSIILLNFKKMLKLKFINPKIQKSKEHQMNKFFLRKLGFSIYVKNEFFDYK